MFDFDSSGLRKSKYYMTPNEEKKLSSISGLELNPQLSNIYRAGIYAQDSDIRNVICYNDISKGHSNKNLTHLSAKTVLVYSFTDSTAMIFPSHCQSSGFH